MAEGKKYNYIGITSGDQNEDRLIKMVFNDKNDSSDFYKEEFKKFNQYEKLYKEGAKKTNVPWGRSNLKVPLGFQQVEAYVSNMLEIQLGDAPYISYEGRYEEDKETGEVVTEHAQFQLEEGDFSSAHQTFLRDQAKMGTSVLKVPWELKVKSIEEEVIEIQQVPSGVDELGNPLFEEIEVQATKIEEIKEKDGPGFHKVSIYDFFVPKSAVDTNIQDLEWCIHRTYRSIDELVANPNYKNTEKLKALQKDDNYSNKPQLDSEKQTSLDINSNSKGDQKFCGKVEVLEWWGEARLTKDGPKVPALIVVGIADEDIILLRKDENPFKFKFKPFVASNYIPRDDSFYGYSVFDQIDGLIEEATALRNARLDSVNMSLHNMWLVERQAGVNLRELYFAPNKIVLTDDNAGIREVRASGPTAGSYQEIARLDFDVQQTTDIQSPSQAGTNLGGAFSDTATGVNFVAQKSNLRMKALARWMEQTYFKPLAKILLWHNKEFITDETFFKFREDSDNPYRMIGPEDLLREFDFKPVSNPSKLSLVDKRANLEYLLQVIAQIQKTRPDIQIDVEFILKEFMKYLGLNVPKTIVQTGPTTIAQMPDGSIVDQKGQPVQVVRVDENGNVVQ